MLYFHRTAGTGVDRISAEYPREWRDADGGAWLNRNDFKTFQAAEIVAAEATALGGDAYMAVDSGPNVSPRYDVIRAPALGDKVSYAFNGDYYPCGEITRISPSGAVITVSEGGKRFHRRGLSGAWVNAGTWCLVPGHISRLNPSF